MRKTIILPLLYLGISIHVYAQEINLPSTNDLFKLVFYLNPNDSFGFYEQPDSLIGTSYEGYASKMWAFNSYLLTHYSRFTELQLSFPYQFPASDTIKFKEIFTNSLNEDVDFQRIYKNSCPKKISMEVQLNQLAQITSRFIYLHQLPNGEITTHFCAGINEVLELPQSSFSPYLNAFCYSVIRNLDDNQWNYIYKNMVNPAKIPLDITEEELKQLKLSNYAYFEHSTVFQKMIIDEYHRLKPYLNFALMENN